MIMSTPRNPAPPAARHDASSPEDTAEYWRERYEQLFSGIPVMLHSIDAKGRILSVSDLWLEKLGYARDEVLGRPSTDFLTEESRRYAKETTLPLFFAQGYCRDVHYQMVAKDGSLLDVLLSATAEYAPDGSVRRSLAVLKDITALKEVEQSLRESEQRLTAAFRGSRDGVWDWNATTGQVYYSRAWAEMLGYEEDELGDSFSEWESRLHPDDREDAFASLQNHLDGRSPYHEVMHRLRCKDGVYKWILSRGVAVTRDEAGQAMRVIGTHTDLSEYKRIEQELAHSRSGLALAQSIAHIGSWEWDVAADRIDWSDEIFRIFGEPPGSFVPDFESYLSRVHPEDQEKLSQTIKQTMKAGDSFSVEHRILQPDGGIRHVQGLGQVKRDDTGAVTTLTGTVQDVTLRKQAEDALRDSEEKFRAMSNACLDALIMIDAEDVVAFWSPAAERMFGYTALEAMGSRMHDLIVPEEYRAKAAQGLKSFTTTGAGPVIGSLEELPVIRKDGTVFPVERSVSAFFSAGRWYAVGMLRDITQRKLDEKRLQELATVDGLTGLTNRRHFLELLDQACRHAARYQEPLSLIVFDIDHFKKVNDTHGHDAGDSVLAAVSATCRGCLRESDIPARLGGEEFAACLPQTDLKAAVQAAERLRCAIRHAQVPIETAPEPVTVTISLGVAQYQGGDETLHSLLRRADQALYDAKHSGRDRVRTQGG